MSKIDNPNPTVRTDSRMEEIEQRKRSANNQTEASLLAAREERARAALYQMQMQADNPNPTPSLAGLTSWRAGLRDPSSDEDPAAFPGQYEVVLRFDDLAVVKAWCAWIIAQDEAWRGAAAQGEMQFG